MLSVSHLTLLDAPPPELVTAAASAGFDAVGVRVWPGGDEPPYPMLGETPMLRETVTRLADSGLRVLDVEVLRLLPDSTHAHALRVLDAGVALGARGVLIIANDPDEARLTDRYAAICAAAGERGLRACLEFMVFSAVRTLPGALRVVRAAAHPAAAVLVDALHLARSGGSPADLAAVDPGLLPYAQLCDAPATTDLPLVTEARGARLLPGDGELPLRDLVAALPPDADWAVEAPVAAYAGLPLDERARRAHAALARTVNGGEDG